MATLPMPRNWKQATVAISLPAWLSGEATTTGTVLFLS